MTDKITIAIVGFGNMGRKHWQRLQESADFRVTVIIDTKYDGKEGEGKTGKAGEEILYLTDYRDFRPDMASAVIIAVPSALHCEVGLYFLNLGVHVFMEKPLALSAEDCHRLASACDTAGVVGMVGMVERFNPAFVACYDIVRRPDIKPHIKAGRFRVERFNPTSAISDSDVVMDLLVHDLDILLFLLGGEVSSMEVLDCRGGCYGYDFVSLRLFFSGGGECELSVGRGEHCPEARRYWVGSWEGWDGGEIGEGWDGGEFRMDFLARRLDYFRIGAEEYYGEGEQEDGEGDSLTAEHKVFAMKIRDGGGGGGFRDNLAVMDLLFEIVEKLDRHAG